jgi:8-oxo-dGTP diphosphatase
VSDTVRAAGGIVWRRDDRTRALLVHRPRYDDWAFPKGKAMPGEDDEACAIREVLEETGCRCATEQELRQTSYVDSRGRPKRVRWWRMHVVAEERFEPGEEVDELRWCTRDEALELLSYDRDRPLLDALAIVLLRHGDARDRKTWPGDDRLRPLNMRGAEQARRLIEPLRKLGPTRIVSSPYTRCIETVEPLAAAMKLAVKQSAALAEGAAPEEAMALLDKAAPGTVACTHGDVVEAVLEAGLRKGAAALLEPAAHVRPRIVGSISAD